MKWLRRFKTEAERQEEMRRWDTVSMHSGDGRRVPYLADIPSRVIKMLQNTQCHSQCVGVSPGYGIATKAHTIQVKNRNGIEQ
jgi:hypothetical protein